jgi:hypothetical protein
MSLTRGPLELAASQEVQVKMRHGFSSIWSVIDDNPESVFGVSFLTGNLTNR